MKKTCLCIIGLLFVGTLCVPVAADTGDQDYWSFNVVNMVIGHSNVKFNGQGSSSYSFQKVYVANFLDQVEVKFEVAGGPDTTVTITKEYMNKLRKEHPGWEPAVVTEGMTLTYDVDVGGFALQQSEDRFSRFSITRYEHLMERGLYHWPLQKSQGYALASDNSKLLVFSVRS